jgi:hypothetical protein
MRILTWLLGALLMVLSINPASGVVLVEKHSAVPSLDMKSLGVQDLLNPNSRSPASAKHECRIELPGYKIRAVGYGASESDALADAREQCGSKYIDLYFSQRRAPNAQDEADAALPCINLHCI